MDSGRFDELAQRLAAVSSRRTTLRVAAAALATAAVTGLGRDADAKKGKGKGKGGGKGNNRCRDLGQSCGGNQPCCSGGACDDVAGICACPDGKIECNGKCVADNATCVVKVTKKDQGDWVVFDNTTLPPGNKTNGVVEFVKGPEEAPRGAGSVQFTTNLGSDKATLSNPFFEGLAIADIATFQYSTFVQTGSGQVAPAVKLEIAYSGGAETGHLIFEPVYYLPGNTVVEGEWQTWDLVGANAKWWAFSTNFPSDDYVTWATILTRYPDAVITGAFEGKFLHVETGSGTPGKVGNVDELIVNNYVFNFEPGN